MNIVEIEETSCEEIREELKGRSFFAVSIENGKYEMHIPDHLMSHQIIFGIELVRTLIMNSELYNVPIDN